MKIGQINELTRSAYDKTAEKYHHHFKDELLRKQYDRLILDKFSDSMPDNSVICDAGCGPSGHMGRYLAEKGHRVIGIDLCQKCVDIATEYNPTIEFKTMDMMNTTFGNAVFDGIIAFYSIIYTPKKYINQIFSEFNRILKPDGKLIVVVKKGVDEGIIVNDWYEGNSVYFTHFLESEMLDYLIQNHFKPDFLYARKPYDFEINVERIYAIGTKEK